MNFKKLYFLSFLVCLVLFSGCLLNTKGDYSPTSRSDDRNPIISSTASKSQDFIFNTDSIGFTTITIRRSEWNKMLEYFDYFYKNENLVIAESYEYEKDGTSWKLNTVGLRLRGNTSRFRPQGKDEATDETGHYKQNATWSQDYYWYAKYCDDNDYRQSHFKVDFEPFDDDDRKMSDCMKGVALKRCDSYFSREIFCYKLFHQYGIWTAPRASQTKVIINFVEDIEKGKVKEDLTDCKVTKVDFGVYEMFEEVNKQSLKGRMEKKGNNSANNAWKNNDGDLWKCSGGDLSASSNSASNFGCENIVINNTDQPKSQWSFTWYGPCYDLKTNKSNGGTATTKFQGFITELNNLSNISQFTEEGKQARIDFYEKWFDVDFFIKTYAVNMLVNMDDDYWGNANNYYLYFDNGKGGSGKCYLIPFDYDNSLGCSITGDKVYTNPFEWGNGHNRPLLDRLLEVPEYTKKLKDALLEVSSQDSESPWNKYNCYEIWDKWKAQVSDYTYSKDIDGHHLGATGFKDDGGWKGTKHYLTRNGDWSNLYEQVTNNFRYWLSSNAVEIKFDLNGGKYNGVSGVVSEEFNGVTSRFDAMIGTPVREGYEFVGWTKTKNGDDFTENYAGEENLTVYASWVDVSSVSGLSIFNIKDSNYDGIKIYITNLPDNHYRRTFYINGKEVGGDSCENPDKYRQIWVYPFTEPGKTYEVYVSYSDVNYSGLGNSNKIKITADSGIGEFKVTNKPSYYIENNILKWKTEPIVQLGNLKIREDDNWDEYYLLEVQSTKKKDTSSLGYHESWNYQSWNWLGASCNTNFNFKDHVNDDVLDGIRYDLRFRLRYNYNSSPYGDLCLIILDYGDVADFNLK